MPQKKEFRGVKIEVRNLVTKMRGHGIAVEDTKKWFRTTRNSAGDNSVKKTNNIFVPGKIYVFRYNKPVNKNKMWDRNPVVLSLGRVNNLDVGINLNYLPYIKRLNLLDLVYSQFKNKIESSLQLSGGDALSQSQLNEMQYEVVERFLKKQGYMKAFRKYKTTSRSKGSIIGYTKWHRVALLNIIDIKNGDIQKAHKTTNK